MPALEAMANGVPVVLPDHGSFSEMVADTGGGVLHQAARCVDLAEKLAELLRDPVRATELGLAGQQAVQDRYHAEAMARQTRRTLSIIARRQSREAVNTIGTGFPGRCPRDHRKTKLPPGAEITATPGNVWAIWAVTSASFFIAVLKLELAPN